MSRQDELIDGNTIEFGGEIKKFWQKISYLIRWFHISPEIVDTMAHMFYINITMMTAFQKKYVNP